MQEERKKQQQALPTPSSGISKEGRVQSRGKGTGGLTNWQPGKEQQGQKRVG